MVDLFVVVALEARRMDKIKEAIMSAEDPEEMLYYCTDVCRTLVENQQFRHTVSGDRKLLWV